MRWNVNVQVQKISLSILSLFEVWKYRSQNFHKKYENQRLNSYRQNLNKWCRNISLHQGNLRNMTNVGMQFSIWVLKYVHNCNYLFEFSKKLHAPLAQSNPLIPSLPPLWAAEVVRGGQKCDQSSDYHTEKMVFV